MLLFLCRIALDRTFTFDCGSFEMYLNGFSDVPKIFSSIQRRNFFIIHKTHCNLRQSTIIAFLLVSILISTVLMREARLRCEFLFISQTTWLKHWDAPSIWPHHQLCTDLRKVGTGGALVCLLLLIGLPLSPTLSSGHWKHSTAPTINKTQTTIKYKMGSDS